MFCAVNLVAQENALAKAVKLAERLGDNSPIAVQTCLATLRNQKVVNSSLTVYVVCYYSLTHFTVSVVRWPGHWPAAGGGRPGRRLPIQGITSSLWNIATSASHISEFLLYPLVTCA